MYRLSKEILVTKILKDYENGDVLAQVVTKRGTYVTLLHIKDIPGYSGVEKADEDE